MAHDLVRFCEEARGVVREARDILAECEHGEAYPARLRERFGSLYRRTRHPEVRAMVTGPLKAGKSTMLNVLASNPHISQISQLPAYPCFVEVRDLERDHRGRPTEEPRSLFFRRDGSLGRETSHQEGIDFLDSLLEDYIRAGKDAPIEYERVVQKVDLPSGEPGIRLVLVDAPGLFFNRRVDETFFPAEELEAEGEQPEVLDRTRDIYLETDVVIFIIRPEQLFFEAVADYLRTFARRGKMRVFIVVNASTRSKVQRGEQIVDFNQVEEHEKIREYFLQHIADGRLLEDIRSERRISLHFADLLDAATAMFTPEGDHEAFRDTPSGNVIERIRGYIFGADLAARKIEDLSQTISHALERAEEHLSRLRERQEEARLGLEAKLEDRRRRVAEALVEVEREQARLDELEEEESRLQQRLETTRIFLESRRLPESSDDPALAEFLSLAEMRRLPERIAADLEKRAARDARETIDLVYRRWRKRGYGERTLRSLAEALWEAKPDGDAPSLGASAQQAVRDCFREVVRQAGEQVNSPQLRECLERIDPSRLVAQGSNPVFGRRGMPLLEFPARFTFKWDAWKTGFRLTPQAVWGEQGRRPIVDLDEERLLYDYRKSLLRQIWGEPWNLGDFFRADHLQGLAREILLGKLSRTWGVKVAEDLASCRMRIREQHSRLEASQRRHDELREELEAGVEQIEASRRLEEDLARRSRQLADLHSPAVLI